MPTIGYLSNFKPLLYLFGIEIVMTSRHLISLMGYLKVGENFCSCGVRRVHVPLTRACIYGLLL
jgi:hypothetical protein